MAGVVPRGAGGAGFGAGPRAGGRGLAGRGQSQGGAWRSEGDPRRGGAKLPVGPESSLGGVGLRAGRAGVGTGSGGEQMGGGRGRGSTLGGAARRGRGAGLGAGPGRTSGQGRGGTRDARRGSPGRGPLPALPAGTAVGRAEAAAWSGGDAKGAVRSLASGRREPVGARRGGLEVAGPGEATMKPSGEDEAAPAGGPWEECFEAAVQLALRAGQVRSAALFPRPAGSWRAQPQRAGPGGALTAGCPLETS